MGLGAEDWEADNVDIRGLGSVVGLRGVHGEGADVGGATNEGGGAMRFYSDLWG